MALFDIFKKKEKEKTKKTLKKKAAPKAARVKAESEIMKQDLDEALRPKEQKIEPQAKRIEKKQSSNAYWVLKSPHVTEKSGMLADKNSYVFKVSPVANKHDIKKAVQDLYGVGVERVAVINIPKKARRVGRTQGFKAGFRKAIVKLEKGEKIEIMPR